MITTIFVEVQPSKLTLGQVFDWRPPKCHVLDFLLWGSQQKWLLTNVEIWNASSWYIVSVRMIHWLFGCVPAYRQKAHMIGIPEFKWLDRYKQQIVRKSVEIPGKTTTIITDLKFKIKCFNLTDMFRHYKVLSPVKIIVCYKFWI